MFHSTVILDGVHRAIRVVANCGRLLVAMAVSHSRRRRQPCRSSLACEAFTTTSHKLQHRVLGLKEGMWVFLVSYFMFSNLYRFDWKKQTSLCCLQIYDEVSAEICLKAGPPLIHLWLSKIDNICWFLLLPLCSLLSVKKS